MSKELDKKNVMILKLLQEDGKLTIQQLGYHVNLSKNGVQSRIKFLEEKKYIKSYMAVLNPEKVGKNMTLFTLIKLVDKATKSMDQFCEDVLKLKNITNCYKICGSDDFLLHITVADMPEYNKLLAEIGHIKHAGSIRSAVVLEQLKEKNVLDLSDLFMSARIW